MYSGGHALLSLAVGAVAAGLASGPIRGAGALAVAAAVGVGIDLDHFVIARLNRGDWRNLRRCVDDPWIVLGDQAAIFDAGDVWRDQRLLSHLLLGGALSVAAWVVGPFWGVTTAAAVYVHLAADLYADGRTRAAYVRRTAERLEE